MSTKTEDKRVDAIRETIFNKYDVDLPENICFQIHRFSNIFVMKLREHEGHSQSGVWFRIVSFLCFFEKQTYYFLLVQTNEKSLEKIVISQLQE